MKFNFLAMLAITSGVYASDSDEPSSTSTQSLRGLFLNEDEESTRGLKRRDDDVCGPETETACAATLNARSSFTLVKCFKDNLPFMDTTVTIVEYPHGDGENLEVFKLTFPQVDFEKFNKANFNAAIGQPRFPAGIFYAEDKEEVIKAVNCAREAGYQISPRGRGHSYQGLGSMDGYMVIDMSLMCNPDDFIDKTFEDDEQEPWLLGGGQKVIGSIKSGAGCTNAVMLAHTAEAFPEGIYLIGSCPTVGIIGYATGGGQGDTTPWVGLGIDDVLSYDIVLYNGTDVTASATQHEDLYWALRGGGSGFGVITSIETAVINAPEESSGFTFVVAFYKQTQNEAREFLKRFQDFLVPDLPIGSKEYKEKIRATSAKFGGGASYNTDLSLPGMLLGATLSFSGLFLGSKDEAESTFKEAGLLDDALLNVTSFPDPTELWLEFSSYADAQLFIICQTLGSNDFYWQMWVYPNYSLDDDFDNEFKLKGNVCEDLGIETKYCYQNAYNVYVPKCDVGSDDFSKDDFKEHILPALKEVAIKPQSWFNRPGQKRLAELTYDYLDLADDAEQIKFAEDGIVLSTSSWVGGLLFGRLDPDVLLEIANVGVEIFHFAHERDETGYFSREEYTLISLNNNSTFSKDHYDAIASILVNKAYDGDASKLKGFYNYLNYRGNRDWRNYYFGDNYERLSVVKAMYDETNGFGNPLQVEPAPLSSKAGKGDIFG